MWLEAIVTKEELAEVMREVLPARIDLRDQAGGDDLSAERWIELQAATDVTLVPDEGLRVTCPAELRWSLAGLTSPTVKVERLSAVLRPRMVERNRAQLLEFQLQIEEASFAGLPSLIDATITNAINLALAGKPLAWNLSDTLTRTLGIGPAVQPLDALKIDVQWGKQRIGADVVAWVVSFKLHIARGT